LVETLLDRAHGSRLDEIYLLTTTAENFFPKFGFVATTRATVPGALQASAEFQGACPDTAVVMKRKLTGLGADS
jgi:amino-acid N-acetyltransferase